MTQWIRLRLFKGSDTYLAALRQQLAQEGFFADKHVRIRAKDGSIKTTSQTVRAERDEHGKIVRYQAILRDVTARARDEEERVRRADETRVLNEIRNQKSYDELQRQVAELEALARVGEILSTHGASREAQSQAVAEIARGAARGRGDHSSA